jgi:hypothetical protein
VISKRLLAADESFEFINGVFAAARGVVKRHSFGICQIVKGRG